MTDQIKERFRRAIINNGWILTMHPSALEVAKDAAREEGRRAGMMEAAQVAWRFNVCDSWASKIAAAIEAKAKEDL